MTGRGTPKHSYRKLFQSHILLHMTRSGMSLKYQVAQEEGWAPGQVWTSAENMVPSGMRSHDRSARSESLHRMPYPSLPYRC